MSDFEIWAAGVILATICFITWCEIGGRNGCGL
jgi:hypothetical protein